jgi:DNA mismatch repair protein MutS2
MGAAPEAGAPGVPIAIRHKLRAEIIRGANWSMQPIDRSRDADQSRRQWRRMDSCYTAPAMDPKSLETLEFPKILDRLAGYAAFSASKALARRLSPSTELDEIRQWQAETREAGHLLSLHPGLTIGGAHDVRSQARAASRGAVLEAGDLLQIKSTLIASRTVRRLLEKGEAQYPRLYSLSLRLESLASLIDAISQTLDERGEVLDSASEKLASLRRELRTAHERLGDKLQRLITDPKIVPMLQEPIVTQRDGRSVIPLRVEFKGRLKAVIHDQSASGATLFIEPLSVVGLNNQVRQLELDERDEVRRILAELSGQVGRAVEAIDSTVEGLAAIDLAYAKARYAVELNAHEPLLVSMQPQPSTGHPGSRLRMMKARHPLLEPEQVVPIDLVLDDDTFALVITGPNTGGKTVTLKTAGLLVLMAQSGLHIPAQSGSELSLFQAVYADIGDEQSIEQSLSTFSSHISNIIRVLAEADARSLVVLDELGAGTDPQEGSALARAILDTLLERQVTTLVATHYPELKAYAHTTPGVSNASVEFDLASLRPTYRLTIGLPGRSNALAIAERLGLAKELIERARRWIAPGDLRAEDLLDDIRRQRQAAEDERRQAEAQHVRAAEAEAFLEDRLSQIDEERRQILEAARQEGRQQVAGLQEEIKQLRRRLAAAGQPLQTVRVLAAAAGELEAAVAEPPARQDRRQAMERAFEPGDRVRLPSLNAEGVITEMGSDQAEVQIGRLRIRARLDELVPPGSQPELEPGQLAPGLAGTARGPVLAAPPALEIDLRGQTVDEALEALDRYLDAAFLAGLPFVRIIHGKGTGRLRQAIRRQLHDNIYVGSFDSGGAGEGGEGVTVVRLAEH